LAEREGTGGRDEPRVIAAERGGALAVDLAVAAVDDAFPDDLDRHRAHARRRADGRDGGGRLADRLVVLALADVLAAVLRIRGGTCAVKVKSAGRPEVACRPRPVLKAQPCIGAMKLPSPPKNNGGSSRSRTRSSSRRSTGTDTPTRWRCGTSSIPTARSS